MTSLSPTQMNEINNLISINNLPEGRKSNLIHVIKMGLKLQKGTSQLEFLKTLLLSNGVLPWLNLNNFDK